MEVEKARKTHRKRSMFLADSETIAREEKCALYLVCEVWKRWSSLSLGGWAPKLPGIQPLWLWRCGWVGVSCGAEGWSQCARFQLRTLGGQTAGAGSPHWCASQQSRKRSKVGSCWVWKTTYSEKHLLYDPLRCHVEKGHTQLSPDLSLHIWTYTSKSSLTRETGCGTWDSRGV